MSLDNLTYEDFYKFIEDNFKNKEVILALDTAARYIGELTSSFPKEITIYIKSEDKTFKDRMNSFLVEQMVVTTFFHF